MELRERILRERIDNVVGPRGSGFVDSMGREHANAMDMVRAELRYVLHRKF